MGRCLPQHTATPTWRELHATAPVASHNTQYGTLPVCSVQLYFHCSTGVNAIVLWGMAKCHAWRGRQETFINQPNEDQQATWLDFPSRSILVFIICPYFKDIELYIRNQLKSTEVYDSHCILRIQVISLYLPPLNILAHQKWTHFNKTVAFEPKFWCFGTSWDVRLPKRPHPQSLSGLCLDLSG